MDRVAGGERKVLLHSRGYSLEFGMPIQTSIATLASQDECFAVQLLSGVSVYPVEVTKGGVCIRCREKEQDLGNV